jgi:DnaJ-class molecular chaperone
MRRKGPSLVVKLFLSLKDLYTGKKFQMIVNKRVDCPRCTGGYEKHWVDIPAGTRAGEELTIEEGFNEYQNAEAADIVFKVYEVRSRHFERNGLNLQYYLRITLKEVKTDER